MPVSTDLTIKSDLVLTNPIEKFETRSQVWLFIVFIDPVKYDLFKNNMIHFIKLYH